MQHGRSPWCGTISGAIMQQPSPIESASSPALRRSGTSRCNNSNLTNTARAKAAEALRSAFALRKDQDRKISMPRSDACPPRYNIHTYRVDLDINRPAVTSTNQFLGMRRWKAVEGRYFKLIRALQKKGTKSAKRHLRK